MARKPMVTRTITSTRVNVLCLDLVKAEPFNKEFFLAGTYKTDKEVLKAVEEIMDIHKEKPVHVVLMEKEEHVYGMTEQDFITHADELDENRKPILKVEESETVEQ